MSLIPAIANGVYENKPFKGHHMISVTGRTFSQRSQWIQPFFFHPVYTVANLSYHPSSHYVSIQRTKLSMRMQAAMFLEEEESAKLLNFHLQTMVNRYNHIDLLCMPSCLVTSIFLPLHKHKTCYAGFIQQKLVISFDVHKTTCYLIWG
jgi:hypothetical protein